VHNNRKSDDTTLGDLPPALRMMNEVSKQNFELRHKEHCEKEDTTEQSDDAAKKAINPKKFQDAKHEFDQKDDEFSAVKIKANKCLCNQLLAR